MWLPPHRLPIRSRKRPLPDPMSTTRGLLGSSKILSHSSGPAGGRAARRHELHHVRIGHTITRALSASSGAHQAYLQLHGIQKHSICLVTRIQSSPAGFWKRLSRGLTCWRTRTAPASSSTRQSMPSSANGSSFRPSASLTDPLRENKENFGFAWGALALATGKRHELRPTHRSACAFRCASISHPVSLCPGGNVLADPK